MAKKQLTAKKCKTRAILGIIFGAVYLVVGLSMLASNTAAGVISLLLGAGLLYYGLKMRKQYLDMPPEEQPSAAVPTQPSAAAVPAQPAAPMRNLVEQRIAQEKQAAAPNKAAAPLQNLVERRIAQEKQAAAEFAAVPRAAVELLPAVPDDGSEPLECKHSTLTARTKLDEFVVIDTETTGLHKGKDKILELGAVRFVGGKPVEIFETLVNPGRPIPKEVTAINHITDDMVSGCPTIREVLPAFDRFVGASNVVGHNLDFDLGFILKAGSRMAHTKRRYYCTLEQSKKILKTPKRKLDSDINAYVKDIDGDWDVEDCKLNTLCEYYGIVAPDAHRASADAYATGQLLLCLADSKKEAANV